MRPVAIGAGVLAVGLTGVAVHQGLAASSAYGDADRMVGADGLVRPGLDPARYYALRDDGDRARRNALVSAGVAAAFAATAGALGWISWGAGAEPALALRF
jgi:hypothetical protein